MLKARKGICVAGSFSVFAHVERASLGERYRLFPFLSLTLRDTLRSFVNKLKFVRIAILLCVYYNLVIKF